MSADREQGEPGFLERWSRLKAEAREAQPAPEKSLTARADTEEPVPPLPSIDKLTLDSDFRGFFHPKVNEDVRRAALRKLFSEPHFNVMDGLDVYIDDYSKSEPIPAAMLAGLKQAQRILEWAAEKKEGAETAPSSDEGTENHAAAEASAAPATLEAQPPAATPETTFQPDRIASPKSQSE